MNGSMGAGMLRGWIMMWHTDMVALLGFAVAGIVPFAVMEIEGFIRAHGRALIAQGGHPSCAIGGRDGGEGVPTPLRRLRLGKWLARPSRS